MTPTGISLEPLRVTTDAAFQVGIGLLIFAPLMLLLLHLMKHDEGGGRDGMGRDVVCILLGTAILGLLPSISLVILSSLAPSLALSMNMGGFFIPMILSLVILWKLKELVMPALFGAALVGLFAAFLVDVEPGITRVTIMDVFLLGALSAFIGMGIAQRCNGDQVGSVLVIGFIGTFVGVDLMPIVRMGLQGESIQGTIGGGGPLDAIFLVGLSGFWITFLIPKISGEGPGQEVYRGRNGGKHDWQRPLVNPTHWEDRVTRLDVPMKVRSSPVERVKAGALDYLLVWSVALLVGLAYGPHWRPFEGPLPEFLAFVMMWSMAALLLYHTLFEIGWHGRTPGKRVFGLKVVDLHGSRPGPMVMLTRNVYRLVEMLLLFVPSLALMLTNERGQRVGDLLGGTMVIRDIGGT